MNPRHLDLMNAIGRKTFGNPATLRKASQASLSDGPAKAQTDTMSLQGSQSSGTSGELEKLSKAAPGLTTRQAQAMLIGRGWG